MPTAFIMDEKPNMTPIEKNAQLSEKLVESPYNQYDISSIERDDVNEGWNINYK